MPKTKVFCVGDEVVINLNKNDYAVTTGMLSYNGKKAVISNLCRVIGPKRKKELEQEIINLRKENNGMTMLERSQLITYKENLYQRYWAPYGYILEGVVSPCGVPYTFMGYMLKTIEEA